MILHLDGNLLGNSLDQVLHSFLLFEVARDDPDETQAVHKLGNSFFKTDNAFLIKGLELSDERRQELDVIFCLGVFSDKLLHGRVKFLEGLLDGTVLVLIAVVFIVLRQPLLNNLDLFLRKLLMNRAQPSVFLLPAINFSSGRGFLLDLLV
jgi:hypothetical protein